MTSNRFGLNPPPEVVGFKWIAAQAVRCIARAIASDSLCEPSACSRAWLPTGMAKDMTALVSVTCRASLRSTASADPATVNR